MQDILDSTRPPVTQGILEERDRPCDSILFGGVVSPLDPLLRGRPLEDGRAPAGAFLRAWKHY